MGVVRAFRARFFRRGLAAASRALSFVLPGALRGALPVALLGCWLLWGCSSPGGSFGTGPSPNPQVGQLELVTVATGFTNPLDLQQPNDGSGRLFVVEQGGRIRIIDGGGNVLPVPLLDLALLNRVVSGGETGLLGLAFHPNFSQNGCFYINYTTTRFTGNLQTVIAEYRVLVPSSNVASTIENVLFTVNQPFENHNGGGLAFGPDGFLYIGLGDGGGAGDPLLNGQNVNTPLGKMLRIAVSCGGPFTIPPDNPFVSQPSPTNEIWALGLRNPFRFSFDRLNGQLFAGDVGENRFEEVDIIQKGKNYGWNTMEGNQCFSPMTGCNMTGLELPIFSYDHSQGDDAITGGYVYRGSRIPSLAGVYVFGDFVSGRIWGLTQDALGNFSRTPQLLSTASNDLSSFGQDQAGELYVVRYSSGIVARIHQVGTP